jgi:hypothetical protein
MGARGFFDEDPLAADISQRIHLKRQAEKDEQEIAEACNRLIKSGIICWNYLYLAHQVEKALDTQTKQNLIRLIVARSPMSWAHINMLVEYDLSEEKLRDTFGILPPKKVAENTNQNRRIKNPENLARSNQCKKFCGGFGTFMLTNPYSWCYTR